MLTTAIALAPLLAVTGNIDLPAGYYTVRELAVELSRQKVVVVADGSCASDTYAIRADHVGWGELSAALTADGRLLVRQEGGGWRIERDIRSKTSEAVASNRYRAEVQRAIHEIYTNATNAVRGFERLSVPQKSQALENFWKTPAPPTELAARELTTRAVSHDILFPILPIVADITRPNQDSFSHSGSANLLESLPGITPSGNPRELTLWGFNAKEATDAQLNEVLRGMKVVWLLMMDPLTLYGNATALGISSSDSGPSSPLGVTEFNPTRLHLVLPTKQILGEEALAALERRVAETEPCLRTKALLKPWEGETGQRVASQWLLRVSTQTQTNIVYYVPQFADFQFALDDAKNLPEAIRKMNAQPIAQDWLHKIASEQSNEACQPATLALTLPARLTVQVAGSFCVVRNEFRFLDPLCAGQIRVPTEALNANLKGEPAEFETLASSLKRLDVGALTTANFPNAYLSFCNPIRLRPYAILWSSSIRFRQALLEASNGSPVRLALTELEPGALEALVRAMDEMNALIGLDPVATAKFIRRVKPGETRITVTKAGVRYSFTLEQRYPSSNEREPPAFFWDGIPAWSSWVDNVSVPRNSH